MFKKNQPPKVSSRLVIADPSTIPFKPVEKRIEIQKHFTKSEKHPKAIDARPIIVDNMPEQSGLTKIETVNSDIKGNDPTSLEPPGADSNGADDEINKPVKPTESEPDKTLIVNKPDVPPQFPGGIKELIKFLKRNLNSPQEMPENEEITVKIRFVVGYNGDLMGFDVVETGGELFDNEVIRVLKKMPKWVPGVSNGETVSTYFIIPIKFIASDY